MIVVFAMIGFCFGIWNVSVVGLRRSVKLGRKWWRCYSVKERITKGDAHSAVLPSEKVRNGYNLTSTFS